MNWEMLEQLLNVAEKLRGLPGYGNLLQLVTTEIAEMEAEAAEQIRTDKVEADAKVRKEVQAQHNETLVVDRR